MRKHAVIALMACAAVAGGCGDDESDSDARAKRTTVSLAERHAQLEKDPYDLRCSDIRDKIESARITRVVQYALADDAQIKGLNRLQAGQSIYFAITELCKGKPGSYRPANDAVAGVHSGEFRADLGTP